MKKVSFYNRKYKINFYFFFGIFFYFFFCEGDLWGYPQPHPRLTFERGDTPGIFHHKIIKIMKFSAKFILAMFNKSKSGKSWIYVDGVKMYIISDAVYQMLRNNEIVETEFSAAGDLTDEADPTKVVFNTFRVKDWVESAITRIEQANKLITAVAAFDNDAYIKAKKVAEGLVI